MHIFIPVSFTRHSDILQAYLQEQIPALSKAGHQCTVMCEPGFIVDSLKDENISVLLTDFTNINESVQQVIQADQQYTLVHAYALQSRSVGLKVARHFNIPYIITFYTEDTNELPGYALEVDLLIAANISIQEYLIQTVQFPFERIQVIPHGVRSSVFFPAEEKFIPLRDNFSLQEKWFLTDLLENDHVVSFISQLDEDNIIAVNLIQEVWDLQVTAGTYDFYWVVVGEGSLRPELEKKAAKINQVAGRQLITFVERLTDRKRNTLYNVSNICIASGHYIKESMACGIPTIAVSTTGYSSIMNSEKILAGMQTGHKETEHAEGATPHDILYSDLKSIISDDLKLSRAKKIFPKTIATFFNQEQSNNKLLQLYNILAGATARNCNITYEWQHEHRKLLSFNPLAENESNIVQWEYPKDDDKIDISVKDNGSVELSYSGGKEDFFYLATSTGGFHFPPPEHKDWLVEAGFNYRLDVSLTTCQGQLSIYGWIIEYSATERIAHTVLLLHNGKNTINFTPTTYCTRFRIAIRCSGSGTILLAPVSLFKETVQSSLQDSGKCTNNQSLAQQKTTSQPKKNLPTVAAKTIQLSPLSISLQQVSLCYRRSGTFFLTRNKHMRGNREYWALRDISLSLYEGDTLGLIGRNGSGKSTTSMVISGALRPDKGKVVTRGKVQLLALGIGFRPQLTGRENVMISGTILGMPRKEVRNRMDDIEEFAELGEFFDEPIRTYSAGMKSRLGFAVSTAVQPDILILDEVMSTGDAAFRNKANKRMEEMRERTKTVIVVSHSPTQIKELCSRVVWLEKGRFLIDGSTEEIMPIYAEFCEKPDQWLLEHPETADLLSES